jgi:hypothetical protein
LAFGWAGLTSAHCLRRCKMAEPPELPLERGGL